MPDDQIPAPITPDVVSDITGPSLSEHVISALGLHGDFRDRLVMELAGEIDNLEGDRSLIRSASGKAQCSTRRVKAISVMHQIVTDRDEREARESAVALIANLMRHVRDTLREVQVEPELVQTILTTLMAKVATDSVDRQNQPRALSHSRS